MTARYVFDAGALVAAERGKARVARFFQLVRAGFARILIPLPVVAEWWRGRTDAREEILAAGQVVGTTAAMKAAGLALAREKTTSSTVTIDAIVMATAALHDATVVTSDVDDLMRLKTHFPGVPILSV